jgi:hypothetical protein
MDGKQYRQSVKHAAVGQSARSNCPATARQDRTEVSAALLFGQFPFRHATLHRQPSAFPRMLQSRSVGVFRDQHRKTLVIARGSEPRPVYKLSVL